MVEATYPYGIDFVWLASNRIGQVCALITAGQGPIPVSALIGSGSNTVDEDALKFLKRTASAKVFVEMPNIESYEELAARGLFVYDWTDVHRTNANSINAYELVAVPDSAIDLASLPDCLRELVFELPALSFGQYLPFDGESFVGP